MARRERGLRRDMATSDEKGKPLRYMSCLRAKMLISLHQLSFSYQFMPISYATRLSGISAVSYDGWTPSHSLRCSLHCCPHLYSGTSST